MIINLSNKDTKHNVTVTDDFHFTRLTISNGVIEFNFEGEDLRMLISAVFALRFLNYDLSQWEKP